MNYDSKINNYNANEVNEIGVNTMKVETIQTGWTLVSSSVPDRSKHRWKKAYSRLFQSKNGYESGMTMVEIARRNNVSERTIYRYKAYYDELKDKNEMESK